jgi:hypothetical protein
MIAILLAIWQFLVALGPFLEEFGAAAAGIVTALIELAKITAVITLIAAGFEILFDPKGKQRVGHLVYNLTVGGLGVAQVVLGELEPSLQAIVDGFASSMGGTGPGIAATIATPIGALAAGNVRTASSNLMGGGESTPANAQAQAAAAFEQAFGFGISSAGVTAAFEAVFPEKLNTLNGVGPMLARMAGFDEVAANVLGPLYRNAFGRALEYEYRSTFTPEFPDEEAAAQWTARGLAVGWSLDDVWAVSGLKEQFRAAKAAAAFRPVPPFLLARAAEAGVIPIDQLTAALTFAGFRPTDITTLETAYAALALQPYQQQYLVAAVRSTELGTMTPQELGGVMNDISLNQDQQALVQLTVATRKLEQLAELYRRSISEAYKYGLVTDAQYVPELEAIGIGAADAQAHYAIDSIAKTGKAAAAELKAEARLAAQQQRGGINAAVAEYKAGTTTAVELGAALLLLGVDPTVAAFIVTVQEQRKLGPAVFVYGVELPRAQALVLREKVAALGRQVTAGLVAPADALTALAENNVPDANAAALVASWAATKTPAADVGVLLPR